MPAPDSVISLVERFREHRDEYLSAGYNEATLRREFLEPMFKALGWDVDNTKGYTEAYKEVVHEDSIRISGSTKAPDYAFRLGGVRKFFVEAKKPSIDVKGDPTPAYQLRRYAWSAKLPLSILTDFHEFAVYDCTNKPNLADSATVARLLYLTCEEYDEHWDEIAELFSPEAIQRGAFDKHAASAKKKGTTTVDDAFLKEIETWRDLLAHNLALRNPGLTQRELNTAVQTTIDRVIFLRICEDRGIEEYGVLRGLVNGTCVYARMLGVFRAADERYNSGLFHFRSEKDRPGEPDTLTLGLVIDDKALKEILDALYYPKSPYEFSVLPADILGHVYEQFLGKVIRLTAGHRAVVEEKPEVKKAGGVYYTPTYIVDYIVKNTVGKLLDGMTPKEAGSLRILDPACGSGSFLLGAYQLLLDWHQAWYVGHDPEKWARGRRPKVFRGQDGEWRLTTAERKRILLDCIYGVDIDPQAVEVTKLSLLLKVLEGEDAESIGKTLSLLRERALPDLGKNIQCGNSLIGTDFYDDRLLGTLTEEERYRINAFDWGTAFSEIMKQGGFDAVIGNPPYGGSVRPLRDYLISSYRAAEYQIDTYQLFVERGIQLLRSAGRLGFIIPNPWLTNVSVTALRQLVVSETEIEQIVHFRRPIFPRQTVDTEVVILRKPAGVGAPTAHQIGIHIIERDGSTSELKIPQRRWQELGDSPLSIFLTPAAAALVAKIDAGSVPLSSLCRVSVGLKPYQVGKGKPPQTSETVATRPFDSASKKDSSFLPLVRGADLSRYSLSWSGDRWIGYGDWLAEPRRSAGFGAPEKLLARQTSDHLVVAYDNQQFVAMNNCHALVSRTVFPDLKYILGLLNSRVLNYRYEAMNPETGEALAEVKSTNLKRLPIRVPRASDVAARARHDRLATLVNELLVLHKSLLTTKTDHEKAVLQRQIEATDRRIDQLVYELYGLTDEEIRIVEEAAK
jgi:predicted type IV restriction endonuclease